MEVRLKQFAFKPRGKKAWLRWSRYLKAHKSAVIKSLENEAVLLEACFISADDHLYYLIVSRNLGASRRAAAKSVRPIDVRHRRVLLSTLREIGELRSLFVLSAENH